MSMKEKMHRGELYLPNDPEIVKEQTQKRELPFHANLCGRSYHDKSKRSDRHGCPPNTA